MVEKLPFLSDDHHYAIAAVATRAAQLDNHIELALSTILESKGLRAAAENILKNMNGDRHVNLLRDMFVDCLPKHKEQIEIAFALLSKLRTQRDEILDWLYAKSDYSVLATSASVRPYRQHHERDKTAQQIHAIAEGFLDMTLLVTEWHSRSLALPWPPAQRDAGTKQPRA